MSDSAPHIETRWLTIATIRGMGRLPFVLVFIIPSTAAFMSWRRGGRRNWIWTEWVGGITATLLLVTWMYVYFLGSYEHPPTGWISERIVTTIGLTGTCILSAYLLRPWVKASSEGRNFPQK